MSPPCEEAAFFSLLLVWVQHMTMRMTVRAMITSSIIPDMKRPAFSSRGSSPSLEGFPLATFGDDVTVVIIVNEVECSDWLAGRETSGVGEEGVAIIEDVPLVAVAEELMMIDVVEGAETDVAMDTGLMIDVVKVLLAAVIVGLMIEVVVGLMMKVVVGLMMEVVKELIVEVEGLIPSFGGPIEEVVEGLLIEVVDGSTGAVIQRKAIAAVLITAY